MSQKSNRPSDSLFSFIPSMLGALLIALVFRTTAVQAFNIPSGSATPTLLTGDYVFVSKFSYGYSRYSLPVAPVAPDRPHGRLFAAMPKRGDTAVFVNPKNGVTLLKRIVGLPGDRIQLVQGVLVINGEASGRERLPDYREKEWDPNYGPREILRRHYRETLPNGVTHEILGTEISRREDSGPVDNTEIYVVPDGHFFAMGDNRDDSTDSRYLNELGYVPLENLIGRAELRFVSLEPGAHLYEFWRWPATLRVNRFFGPVH